MKKLFLLVTVVTVTAISAMAQQQKETAPSPAQKDAKATEQKDVKPDQKDQMKQDWDKKIKEELQLTTEQVEKYDALNKEYGEKFETIAKDASLTPDAQKEKKMSLKKEKEGKFFEILTPEQQTKYKELKESWEKKNSSKPAEEASKN